MGRLRLQVARGRIRIMKFTPHELATNNNELLQDRPGLKMTPGIGGNPRPVPHDPYAQVAYARVVAGLVWPGKNPGSCVVVGENYDWNDRQYHVLDCCSGNDFASFLRNALQLKAMWQICDYYAPSEMAAMVFLVDFNRSQTGKNLHNFLYTEPAFYSKGDVTYHLNLLSELTRPENKKVNYGDSMNGRGEVRGEVRGLPSVINALKDKDVPVAAALAYAVSTMEAFQFQYPKEKEKAKFLGNHLSKRAWQHENHGRI